MGEILWDLMFEDTNEYGLPPGFRFHPTDEELVTFYLASKVYNGGGCGVDIVEVDLNRCEPWELPDRAKMGEREWYFYTLKDRKYPTGLRTNRATVAGYWKATGKDREVYSAFNGSLVGMKKTLVFYRGRAPRGEKTKWILHEYRLDGDFSSRYTFKEEWVICRVIHKEGMEKKNTFIQDNYFPAEASSSSISFQTSPIQTFLQQNNYYTYHFNNNNNISHGLLSSVVTTLPEPSSPANITSHLKSQSNHFPLMETIPVPQQCNVPPTHVQDQFLNWVENSNPNPFGFDVGLFDSSFSCGAAYETPLMLPLQGESLLM